jgi:hypothetical protein
MGVMAGFGLGISNALGKTLVYPCRGVFASRQLQEKAMSVQKVSVLVPSLRAVPPGAAWAANAIAWLFGADPHHPSGFSAWFAAARSRYQADRAARRDAGERMALMALARRYEATQPEFAKDLFAAALADRKL